MNYEDLAGVVESRVRRETGTRVTVYDNDEAGLDDAGGDLPYSTVCEEHGTVVAHPTKTLAKKHARNPTGWCEPCRTEEEE